MPASPLRPGAQRLLGYWGSILNSVEQRASTAEVAAAIRNAQADEVRRLGTLAPPRVSFDAIDLGQIRSLAVGYRRASEEFRAARPEQSLTASMLGSVPWSRALAEQANTPLRVELRFRYDVLTGQTVNSYWATITYDGNVPGTVGGIRDDIATAADAFGSGYGGETIFTGDAWIARV